VTHACVDAVSRKANLGLMHSGRPWTRDLSRRTLQRQIAQLVKPGSAGFVDARMLQEVRRAVDVRWPAPALQVLTSYTNQSNSTKQAVIKRTNEESEHRQQRRGQGAGHRQMLHCRFLVLINQDAAARRTRRFTCAAATGGRYAAGECQVSELVNGFRLWLAQ